MAEKFASSITVLRSRPGSAGLMTPQTLLMTPQTLLMTPQTLLMTPQTLIRYKNRHQQLHQHRHQQLHQQRN